MKIKGAIFDVDGTILDTMKMWEGLGRRFIISYGIKPGKDFEKEIENMSIYKFSTFVKDKYKISYDVDSITEDLLRNVSHYYRHDASLKAGAEELLRFFAEKGIKMCIATAGNKELVESAFKRLGILDYFTDIFTCSEDESAKETGSIYRVACRSLCCNVQEAWVFEDALYAVKSAKKLGFNVAAVYDESENGIEELKAVADKYFISLFDAIEYFS